MKISVLLVLIVAAGSAQAAGWKAGAAAVNITPDEPVWMAGYAFRDKPHESVRQPIYAKALALEDEAGARSVIVTLDLVGIRRNAAEAIAAKIGLPRERILFNASHTHSAPVFGEAPLYAYKMGVDTQKQMAAIARYREFASARIAEAAAKALANLAPATLHFEQSLAGFAVNRRRVGHREYSGPVDHDVPVLAVKGEGGKLVAVLFGYACHNTVMGDYTIHGDYAGYAQEALEKRHPGAVALFVQGAGADQNPLPRRKVEHLERYGTTLADAVDEVLERKMRAVTGAMRVAMESPDLQFRTPPARAEYEAKLQSKDEIERLHAQRMIATLERDGKIRDTVAYPIQAWRFGDAFTLLALAGELVVDYSLRFKASYGPDSLWVAGYSNDVFGYIPSTRVLREGGYEGGGAFQFSAFPGPFAGDVEERIVGAVARVMRKVQDR